MNSPALFLLLASVPRVLLRFLFRLLRQIGQFTGNSLRNATNIEQRQAYSSFINLFNNSPVNIPLMEPVVAELEPIVKAAYVKAGVDDVQRGQIEKTMLTSCELPDVLMSAVKKLLTTMLDKFQEDVDPAKVYFADIRWMGLTDDKSTEAFHKRREFDVVRKVQLSGEVPLRRCTRCCSHMLDFDEAKQVRSLPPWMHGAQKVCVCGNNWVSIGKIPKRSDS